MTSKTDQMHRVYQHMLPVLELIGLHRLQASDTAVRDVLCWKQQRKLLCMPVIAMLSVRYTTAP